MDSAMLSVSHTSVTSTFQGKPLFQTVAELCLSVHGLSLKAPPFAQIKIAVSAHVHILNQGFKW